MAYQTGLSAGMLSAELDGADLTDVHAGDVRVISRLGVRVRELDWSTVPGELSDVEVQTCASGFAVSLVSRHRGEGLDLRWRATIAGDAGGQLSFAMDAVALADSAYARIGLVVLHAAPATAGRPYRALGPGGPHRGRLPTLVGPQLMDGETVMPLVPSFATLELDLDGGPTLRFAFEGDVFEIEDQRNWCDGSFKTYSTPVGLPIPHHVRAGDRLRQQVVVATSGPDARRRRRPGTHTVVEIGTGIDRRLPPIGLALDRDGHEVTELELQRLRQLGPAHVRAETEPADAPARLPAAARTAATLGAELELAVTLDAANPARDLDALAATVRELDAAIARVIVLRAGARVASARDVALLAAAVADHHTLVTGTDGAFADLNRERPAVPALSYPVMPQVHERDDRSLVESLAASGDTVATAAGFAPGATIHVSPVTLGPRGVPADPRQATAVAAAWTVGSIHRLAKAGADSLTYFELTGPAGTIARDHGATPFPVHAVLAEAIRAAGAPLLGVEPEDPLAAEVLALLTPEGPRALVANLRPVAATVTMVGTIEATVRLDGWSTALVGAG
jgi:hypothetical protein